MKRIEDAEHGLDGKSAYEIAVEHGYIGTEEEWLASLHGKDGITPDMSEYPKTTEVTTIIEREIAPVAEEAHAHSNKETLDRLTPELMQELDGLQQFEDSTTYEIQTLNEAVENLRPSTHSHANLDVLNALTAALLSDLQGLQQFEDATNYDIHDIREALLPISSAAHTHNNKDVLDTITEQYMRDEAAFHAQTADALHGLSTGLSEVSAQAHSHSNKAVLDSITQEMLNGIASAERQAHTHHNLSTLNGITDSHVTRWNEAYTTAMDLTERVDVNEGIFERFKTEILYDMQVAKTSITEMSSRLSAVEEALTGVETALADIVEVSE